MKNNFLIVKILFLYLYSSCFFSCQSKINTNKIDKDLSKVFIVNSNDHNKISDIPSFLIGLFDWNEKIIQRFKTNLNLKQIGLNNESIIAHQLFTHYKKIFDYLDYDPVDNLISVKELAKAFTFKWIKHSDSNTDIEEAIEIIKKYSTKKDSKNTPEYLDLAEFCEFMFDYLGGERYDKFELFCVNNIKNAHDSLNNLFSWLDIDSDGLLTMNNLIDGLEVAIQKEVDVEEIKKIFIDKKDINREEFMMIVSLGRINKSLGLNILS